MQFRGCTVSDTEYRSTLEIGSFEIDKHQLIRRVGGTGPDIGRAAFLDAIRNPGTTDSDRLRDAVSVNMSTNIWSWLVDYVQRHYRVMADVRNRPIGQASTGTKVEWSLDGTQTAILLAGLKMGDGSERTKFNRIKAAFTELYPDLDVEVVGGQGGEVASVVFTHNPHIGDLDQQYVGTGVLEILTLITNLVDLDNSVLVVEEPELHLHRLSQVALIRLFVKSSAQNQIILITHSPSFVDLANQPSIIIVRRSENGSTCAAVPSAFSPAAREAFVDAISRDDATDILFARVVLLVEGSTEVEFFKALGPRIGLDLESNGVAVVSVGGDSRFISYIQICQSLDLPTRCLQDKDEGASRGHFKEIFTVLKDEIEAYWKRKGLEDLLTKANDEVGSLSDNKIRFGRWVGNNIDPNAVPSLFVNLMFEMIELSGGSVEHGGDRD